MPEEPFVFIVGSPRSGTTLLGEVLDAHPQIAQWYEPYFIWDRFFREAPDDNRGEEDATEEIRNWIRQVYEGYRKGRGVELVVDKSPRNCLKIPFISAVFPGAAFIFLLRDGRDTIVSIYREWLRRKNILTNGRVRRRWGEAVSVVRTWLKRQPFWKHRLQALLFELGSPHFWVGGRFLHRVRWNGRIGWGPRFRGWENYIDRVSSLEFSALQWMHCMEGVLSHMRKIPNERHYIVRYEDFIQSPEEELREILAFLGLDFPEGLMSQIPQIRSGNFRKWPHDLSREQLGLLGPIIGKTLIKLGYERNDGWYHAESL